MFTAFFRKIFIAWLEPTARWLGRHGITPNVITVIGTLGTIACSVIFLAWQGWFGTACYSLWALTMFDGMDGLVARVSGKGSTFGAVLDSTCDRFADAAVFGALAWWFAKDGERWLLLGCLLCLALGFIVSYIRGRAEALGFDAKVGLAERTDRLIIILVGVGLTGQPFDLDYVLAIAIWLLVGLSAITIAQRFATVYKQAKAADMAAVTQPADTAALGQV